MIVLCVSKMHHFSGNSKEVRLPPKFLSPFRASVQHMSFRKANFHSCGQLHLTLLKHLNPYLLQLFLLLVLEVFPPVHLQVMYKTQVNVNVKSYLLNIMSLTSLELCRLRKLPVLFLPAYWGSVCFGVWISNFFYFWYCSKCFILKSKYFFWKRTVQESCRLY